ncbi:MAG: hypothetical protein K2P80_05085 [Beijerinckiaceae bacterium]|nr:hypothetical protein [Beijerinckiaceae bacterium]
MRRGEWRLPEPIDRSCRCAEGNEEKAACERKVLQEVPEQSARLAIFDAKIARLPELLPEHRGHHAVTGQDEGCGLVRHAAEDGERHKHLDRKPNENQQASKGWPRHRLFGLRNGAAKIQNLVEGAERKKEEHEEDTDGDSDQNGKDEHEVTSKRRTEG